MMEEERRDNTPSRGKGSEEVLSFRRKRKKFGGGKRVINFSFVRKCVF